MDIIILYNKFNVIALVLFASIVMYIFLNIYDKYDIFINWFIILKDFKMLPAGVLFNSWSKRLKDFLWPSCVELACSLPAYMGSL